jgi:hypothetical protein
MFELIFTIMVINKTGIPGFNVEHIARFQALEDCMKSKVVLQEYMDKLYTQGKAFPGVFECRKL